MATTAQHEALVLESRIESADEAESVAAAVAVRAGFPEPESHHIAMAVREITVNAVMHGNGYDPAKKVRVEFSISASDLIVQIRDQGTGFDAAAIPDPLAPENLLRQSGRGIFLARAFMDEVDLRPGRRGTSVRLIKHRPGSAAKQPK